MILITETNMVIRFEECDYCYHVQNGIYQSHLIRFVR